MQFLSSRLLVLWLEELLLKTPSGKGLVSYISWRMRWLVFWALSMPSPKCPTEGMGRSVAKGSLWELWVLICTPFCKLKVTGKRENAMGGESVGRDVGTAWLLVTRMSPSSCPENRRRKTEADAHCWHYLWWAMAQKVRGPKGSKQPLCITCHICISLISMQLLC